MESPHHLWNQGQHDDEDDDGQLQQEDSLLDTSMMDEEGGDSSLGGGGGGPGVLDFDTSTWNEEELAAYQALKSKRKKCAVSGCTSRSIPIAKSYHQLPVRNLEVWQQWVEAIRWSKNDPDWLPQQDQPLVCSRHFDDNCFIKYEGSSRMRLTHTAIPTLYLDPPNGTENMDPRFEDQDRPLPAFVPSQKVRERPSQAKNGGQKKIVRNNLNGNASASRVKTEKEVLEVTPELPTLDEYSNDYYNNDDQYYQGDGSSSDMHYDESGDQMQHQNYDEDASYEDDMTSYLQPEVVMQSTPPSAPQQLQGGPGKRSMPTLKPCPRAPKLEPAVRKVVTPVRMQMQQQQRMMVVKRPQPGASGITQIRKPVMAVARPTGPVAMPRRTMLKMKVTNPGNGMGGAGGGSQKLKIGVTKCRMIVDRIEQYLEESIRQVSEEMEVPVQVVQGIWQVKDRIKQGNIQS